MKIDKVKLNELLSIIAHKHESYLKSLCKKYNINYPPEEYKSIRGLKDFSIFKNSSNDIIKTTIPFFPKMDNDSLSVWDLSVPIIKNGNLYTAFITEEIGPPGSYDQFIYTLANLTTSDTITINVNCPGGVLDTSIMLYNAIRNCKARTIVSIEGFAGSGATFITMASDELYITPHSGYMIHSYSGTQAGKAHELREQQRFYDKQLEELFNEVYKHFLTTDEIATVIDGRDLWFTWTEVQERWQRKIDAELT